MPFEAEIRIRRAADGVFRWFLARAVPISSPQGVVTHCFGTSTEIDDQKRAEQVQHALAEAGRLLASSFDYQSTLANVCKLVIPVLADWCSVDLVDDDGEVRYCDIAHADPAKVELAREFRRLPPARPDDRIGLMRAFRTGEPEFYGEVSAERLVMFARTPDELRRLRALGLRSVMIVPLTMRGRPLGTLTLVMAESSRLYEEADLSLALELGSRAVLAVENARLFEEAREAVRRREEALSELRANDRRKDEFLAMLAHELRNPLAAIDSAVALFDASESDDDQAGWSVDVIGRHVKYLTRMIDDLLDVSRITRGKIQLRKQKIDAYPVLNNAIDSARSLMEQRQHKFSTSFGADLILDADPTRLEQIVVNLLLNAAKYTECDGQIWMTARRDENEVVVSVRDTGIGIPREQLPRVFEPFVQGERSLERSSGGLGIGLTLVHKLSELHGGTVMVLSDGPGMGSEFTVRFPAAMAMRSEPSRPRLKPEPTATRAMRVLIVDDNEDLVRGLSRLLEIHGHQVRVVFDRPSGVDMANEWHPEYVLLDIGLPGMDGFHVATLLRQNQETQDAVIIAISGYGQEEDRNRSKEAGFDYHLVKPINSEEFPKIIANPR